MDNTTRALATPLAELGEQARTYVAQAVAPNTRRAYAADWRTFVAWCEAHELVSLPAEPTTVALFLTDHAVIRRASTLGGYLVAIGQAHHAAGVEEGVVAEQPGHRSIALLRRYIRHGELFRQNAAAAVGL